MTTATLRPNATVDAPDSLTGAASAHAATSDDSDASYYTDDDPGLGVTLSLGTVAMGAGSVAKQARVRHRSDAEPPEDNLIVTAGSETATPVSVTSNVTTAITTYTGAYTPVTWTQTQVDALTINTRYPGASAWEHRVYELFVDLVYVTIPVVALDAITDPWTTSTQITASWVNTFDSDGGAQTAYRLWVTDDGDSDAIVYDSGVVASSSTSAVTGPLTNGGEYTVHIEVAQTVNGAYHWSDPDTQAAVTMSVTTVDVSSVAAVADNTNAKITVTVTREAADGAWEYVELERTTDSGATWEPVRGSTFVAPTGADTHVVDDYEVGNGVDVEYRARATYYSSGLPITSAWVETASATQWTSTSTWFKVPGSPTLNDTFNFKVYPSASRPTRRGVFHVLGAARPIVVADVRASPIAQCSVQTSTEAEANSLLDILDETVVLIQAPTTMKRWGSRYCSIGDLDDEPLDPHTHGNSGYAIWRFDAVEVDAPADPDAGSA